MGLSYESGLFFSLMVTALSLAVFAWRRRPSANAELTSGLMLTIAFWMFALAQGTRSDTLATRMLWLRAEYLAQVITPGLVYLLVLNHTGQKTHITREMYLAIASMTLLTLVVLSSKMPWIITSATLETSSMPPRLLLEYGGFFWLLQLYAYLLFLHSAFILLLYIWRSPHPYREQSSSLLFALLLPLVSNLLYILNVTPVNITPFAAILSGGILTWNLAQSSLFDLIAAGRETVTHHMREGFMVIDALGRIRELNPAAAQALNQPATALEGELLHNLPALMPLVPLLPTAQPAETQLTIKTPTEERYYHAHLMPLRNRRKPGYGHVIVLQDITAQEQARVALEAEERRYHELFERVPAGIFRTAPDGTILEANTALIHLLGAPDRQTLQQHHVNEFYLSLEDRHAWMALLQASAGSVQDVELRLRRLDGRCIWAAMSVQATYSPEGKLLHYDGVVEDITRRKQIETELRESVQRNRAILQALPDLMFVVDVHGTCHEWYASDASLLAAPPEQLQGRKMHEILPPELAARVLTCIRSVQRNNKMEVLEYSLNLKGTEHYFEARVVPYMEDKTLSIVRDITERQLAEARSRAYAARLEILHELERAIIEIETPQTIAELALKRIRESIPCEACNITLLDRSNDTIIVLAHSSDLDPPLLPTSTRIKVQGPILEAVDWARLQHGQILVFEAPQEQLQRIPKLNIIPRERMRSLLIVPMATQENLIGTINLASTQEHAFSADHSDMVSEIAASLAIGIHQAQLRQQARREAEAKSTLLEDVKHRVNGYFTTILSLLARAQLQAHKIHQELHGDSTVTMEIAARYENIIAQLIQRVQGLETVHKMLSETEWQPISLYALATEIIRTTLQALPEDQVILLDISPSSVQVDAKSASSLALILHELTINTIKYGLGKRSHARIRLNISTEAIPDLSRPADIEATLIGLEFRDDGPGYPEAVLRMEGIDVGLQLIQTIVRGDLHGKLILANEQGAITRIYFRTREQRFPTELPMIAENAAHP